MLVMVAHDRGVTALPRWLVEEHAFRSGLHAIRSDKNGSVKKIFLGRREADDDIHYLSHFIEFAVTSKKRTIKV